MKIALQFAWAVLNEHKAKFVQKSRHRHRECLVLTELELRTVERGKKTGRARYTTISPVVYAEGRGRGAGREDGARSGMCKQHGRLSPPPFPSADSFYLVLLRITF